MQSKGPKKGLDSEKECYNCHKKGHLSKDCWEKGGGQEGQGPKSCNKNDGSGGGKNRLSQATNQINNALDDVAYMSNARTFSSYDWMLDSATTSHICNL